MQQINRAQPQMPVGAYQTYELRAPVQTHFRPATCQEVQCPNWLNGWRVRVEYCDPQVLHLATHSGRRYTRLDVAPGESWLVYEPGQPCFEASRHRLQLEREPLYVVRGGDWRANTGTIRNHGQRGDLWTEDFAEHQAGIAAAIERG